MNKHIKELIEANIFKDKAFQGNKPVSSINRAAKALDDKYRWMGPAIYDAYKEVKSQRSISGIQDIMQRIKPIDTFNIPYASFNVLQHFGNLVYSSAQGSFSDFIKTICKIYKGEKISLNWLDVSDLTELSTLFNEIVDITVDISGWDVRNVTKLWKTFENSNISFDASDWELTNCETLDGTFHGAQQISKSIETWKFVKLKSMSQCFDCIESDYFFPDLSKWNVSTVEDLSWCFSNTNSFGILSDSISGLNIKSATNLECCFQKTKGYMDLSGWSLNKKKPVRLNNMFKESDIYDANIKGWNVKKVKSLYNMFDFSPYQEDLSSWVNQLSPQAITTINNMANKKLFNINTLSQVPIKKL